METPEAAVLFSRGYSWSEIGALLGCNRDQARRAARKGVLRVKSEVEMRARRAGMHEHLAARIKARRAAR